MSERKYYKVAPDSPVMAVIAEAERVDREFFDAIKALQEEFGGDVWSWNNCRFAGIAFKGELPPGWRKKDKYAVPDKRVAAGRKLAKRFESLPVGVDAMRFSGMLSRALGGNYEYFGDGHIYWTSYAKYGDAHVLGVPAACKVTPPGCEELKMSEYWQLKEAAEEKACA